MHWSEELKLEDAICLSCHNVHIFTRFDLPSIPSANTLVDFNQHFNRLSIIRLPIEIRAQQNEIINWTAPPALCSNSFWYYQQFLFKWFQKRPNIHINADVGWKIKLFWISNESMNVFFFYHFCNVSNCTTTTHNSIQFNFNNIYVHTHTTQPLTFTQVRIDCGKNIFIIHRNLIFISNFDLVKYFHIPRAHVPVADEALFRNSTFSSQAEYEWSVSQQFGNLSMDN